MSVTLAIDVLKFDSPPTGCELVGFHIEDYCLNFLDCCQRCLGCRADKAKMTVAHVGRIIKVKAMPIGIPYAKFESMAKTAPRVFPPDQKVKRTLFIFG